MSSSLSTRSGRLVSSTMMVSLRLSLLGGGVEERIRVVSITSLRTLRGRDTLRALRGE